MRLPAVQAVLDQPVQNKEPAMAQGWTCIKCESDEFETDEITVTGNGLSKLFNVQNRKFTAVTCKRCTYTEFYRGETSTLGNIVDFMGN